VCESRKPGNELFHFAGRGKQRLDDTSAPGSPAPPGFSSLTASLRSPAPTAPLVWLAAGWNDFRANPRESLFFGACFTFCGYLLAAMTGANTAFFAALVSGYLLVGPALALGLYELSRQRESSQPPDLPVAIAAFRGHLGNIGLLSTLLGVVLLLWGRASMVVFIVFHPTSLPTWEGFLAAFVTLEHLDFVVAWLGVGSVFAVLAFGVSAISIPLMLDRNVDAVSASLTSLTAILRNPWTMALWALIVVVLTVVGFATAFLGLLVITPVLGHATWHAYRAFLPRDA